MPPSHGKSFLAKLDRLSSMRDSWVSDWASKEAKLYRESPDWNQNMQDYLDLLDQWAHREPRPTFVEIVATLARDLRMSRRELLKHRRVWLRRAWDKAIRASKQQKKSIIS